jgi:hypothetical protein
MQRGAKIVLTCVGVGLVLMVGSAVDQANVRAAAGPAGPAVSPVTLAPAAAVEPVAVDGLGSGRWEIGSDVAPGKYRTGGPADSLVPLCTWTVEKAAGGYLDAGTSEGPATYTIPSKPGAIFETHGCQPWVRR